MSLSYSTFYTVLKVVISLSVYAIMFSLHWLFGIRIRNGFTALAFANKECAFVELVHNIKQRVEILKNSKKELSLPC